MTPQPLAAPAPAPTDAETAIDGLRRSIDHLDEEVLLLLERRRELSEAVQHARIEAGGRRTELSRENVVIKRYADRLGRPGGTMAMALLELCRGSLYRPAGSPR
ncbi:chorismate mutase [Streptomyces sp. NRRL S-87]|uniref:chorismate mutase n=1 Tax=Streptomyces sp. NRRL S-87 TaxID=1463920 RepID=UPI0004C1CCD6|nr:chorismate mutase [Streptomyces sp. NRRL S-87]